MFYAASQKSEVVFAEFHIIFYDFSAIYEVMSMKTLVIVILVLFGLYWLFDHAAPMPLNHEQFGLYEHLSLIHI